MKVWLHIAAAVVGLVLAALIVYLVFGNASQEGATQDGTAPTVTGAGTSLCGTVKPGGTKAPGVLAKASKEENLPDVISPTGATLNIEKADQGWFARMQAAGGFCVDEVTLLDGVVRVSMSTTEKVSQADASAYTIAVIASAFSKPFDRGSVTVETFVGEQRRTVLVSRRAWDQFNRSGRGMGLGRTMADLGKFRRQTAYSDKDLKVAGWR